MLDIVKSKKDIETLTPECWECYESCANFTNKFPSGGRDTFPGTNSPRCTYSCYAGYGTSGKDIKSRLINNEWHSWCKLYKPKESIR